MANTLEARKLELRDLLAEVDNEGIILQLEMILKPQKDFWDELSEDDKASIEKGLEQLARGERIPYEEVIGKIKKKGARATA